MTTTIPADLARCPNSHTGAVTERSRADVLARRLLRVPDHAGALTDRAAIQPFRRSMMTSTIRCTLTGTALVVVTMLTLLLVQDIARAIA